MDHDIDYRHLGFLGAGAQYASYCGVIYELYNQDRLKRLQTVVGVSIGAYMGALLCIYKRLPRLKAMVECKKMAFQMLPRHVILDPVGEDKTSSVIEFGNGLYDAKNLIELVRSEMQACDLGDADATLEDLRRYSGIDLKILVCQTSNYYSLSSDVTNLVLDADTFPNMPLWMAIRASCAVFPVISPVRVRGVSSWWLDAALFRTTTVWVQSLIEDLPGQHLVVSVFTDQTMSLYSPDDLWNGTLFEKIFVWLLTNLLVSIEPFKELKRDPNALQFKAKSFPLNFGFNRVSVRTIFNKGRRTCLKHLATSDKLRPVSMPRMASSSVER